MTDCTDCGGGTTGGCGTTGECADYSVTFPPGTLVCGTGSGNFPRPGDPDLHNSALTARSAFRGIAVSWTYPNLNPHAVAHTLLYRNTTADFDTAALIRTVQGDYHLDQDGLVEGTRYFYWIRIVSVNGTVGDTIGPASAVLQPAIEQLIAILEGKLSDSVLNQTLKEKIDLITDVSSALSSEVQERLLGDDYLSQIIAGWASELGVVDTLVKQEILERIRGDDALVAQVNLILAKSNESAAAIQQEQAVRATEDEAIALQVDTLQATVGGISSSVQTLQQVVNGPGGLSAQWTVKTDVNGYVSGFGLYNNGATSEFIVRADTFAVGLAGQQDVFPFIIGQVNGETQIALNARTLIPDAHITNAMIGEAIQSNDFQPGVRGWKIDKNGGGQFWNVVARGNIEASTIKADTIEARHIKGGAVSRVYQDSREGFTAHANSEHLAFTFAPEVPSGMLGNCIAMLHFQGQGSGDATNVGARVVRVKANGNRTTIHTNAITAPRNYTAGSATSFSDSDIAPGTLYEIYLTNTWNQGTLLQGKIGGNMMLTLM